jgi:DNA-directed RNA polymerase subunit M/transcription elongation factor TFIIS
MDLTPKVKCPNCEESEVGMEMFPGSFGVRARFLYVCRKCGTRWEDR